MNQHFVARDRCPACLSSDSDILFAGSYTAAPIGTYVKTFYDQTGPGAEWEYLEGAQYILKECRACTLIYQHEVPGNELMQRLYEHWLDPGVVRKTVTGQRSAEFYYWCATEIARVLCFLKRPLDQVKFLDFGMGWGNWCLITKGFGCNVYGTELSDSRVGHAQQMGIETVEWGALAQHRFDFVNAEPVFEHLADPLKALPHLRGALSDDGVIRINVPSGTDIKRRLAIGDWSAPFGSDRSLNDVAPLQHVNCFNYRSLVAMARAAGLEEVTVRDVLHRPTMRARIRALIGRYLHRLLPSVYDAVRSPNNTNLWFRAIREAAPRKHADALAVPEGQRA